MTSIPPPNMCRAGLRHVNNVGSDFGNELRTSWQRLFARLTPPRGSFSTPGAAKCTADPAIGALETSELYARVFAEMMPRLHTARNAAVWSVHADGTEICRLVQPALADVQVAADALVAASNPDRPGLRGQRDWIGVYFAQELALDPVRHGLVLDLLDIVSGIVMLPTFALKNGADIPRPWAIGKGRLPIIIDKLWHASWPSGHATAAYAFAHVLGRLAGADAAEQVRLDQLAGAIATFRELALVHTPLDSAAGQALGNAVGAWLVEAATTHCADHPAWAALYELARQQL
jgi:hypothetical protein